MFTHVTASLCVHVTECVCVCVHVAAHDQDPESVTIKGGILISGVAFCALYYVIKTMPIYII